jgi:hypothetical protein
MIRNGVRAWIAGFQAGWKQPIYLTIGQIYPEDYLVEIYLRGAICGQRLGLRLQRRS